MKTTGQHSILMAYLKPILLIIFISILFAGCGSEQDKTKKLFTLPPEEFASAWYTISFSPDNQLLAVINSDNQVQIRNIPNNKLIQTFPYPKNEHPTTLAFSSGGALLAVSTQAEIQIWDIQNNQEPIIRLTDNFVQPGMMAFSPDDSLLAFFSRGVLRIWHLDSGEVFTRGYFPGATIAEKILFSPTGDLLAFDIGFLYVWDIEKKEPATIITEHVNSFAFSPEGTELVATKLYNGAKQSEVFRWQMPNGELLNYFAINKIGSLAIIPPSSKEVIMYSAEPTATQISGEPLNPKNHVLYISRWRVEDGKMLWQEKTEEIEVIDLGSLVVSSTGKWLALKSLKNGIHIWQIGQKTTSKS